MSVKHGLLALIVMFCIGGSACTASPEVTYTVCAKKAYLQGLTLDGDDYLLTLKGVNEKVVDANGIVQSSAAFVNQWKSHGDALDAHPPLALLKYEGGDLALLVYNPHINAPAKSIVFRAKLDPSALPIKKFKNVCLEITCGDDF